MERYRGCRRTWRWLAAASTLTVGTSGCIDYLPVEGGSSVPVVLGVVVAGADSAFVWVGSAGPGADLEPAPGTVLFLTSDWGEVPLAETGADRCGSEWALSCYVARLPSTVVPGQRLALDGTLPSGERIRAETVVPETPDVRIAGHPAGGTVPWVERFDSLLAIGLPPGDARIALRDSVVPATWWRDGERRVCPALVSSPPWGFDLRAYPTISGPPSIYLDDPACDGVPVVDWDSLTAPLSFLGYDANATRWYEQHRVFWPDEGDDRRVEGALGMFGSATPVGFLLHITARQAAP